MLQFAGQADLGIVDMCSWTLPICEVVDCLGWKEDRETWLQNSSPGDQFVSSLCQICVNFGNFEVCRWLKSKYSNFDWPFQALHRFIFGGGWAVCVCVCR